MSGNLAQAHLNKAVCAAVVQEPQCFCPRCSFGDLCHTGLVCVFLTSFGASLQGVSPIGPVPAVWELLKLAATFR